MLQPVYGIKFERDLTERTVDNLPGYRGMGPVRVGNAAWRQLQNDNYGSAILAVTQSFFDRRLVKPGNARVFGWLEQLGSQAAALFDQPDAGLWEFRQRSAVHTFSSVMCWAARDRLVRIAKALGLTDRQTSWTSRAEAPARSQLDSLDRRGDRPRRGLSGSESPRQVGIEVMTSLAKKYDQSRLSARFAMLIGLLMAGSMDGLLSPESLRTSPLALSYAIALAAMAPSMATWIFLSPLLLMAFAVVMPSIDRLRRRRKEMSEAAGHRSTGVAGEPFSSDAEA